MKIVCYNATMNDEEKLFINRIKDLAKASYTQNRYTFSSFLTLDEQALVDTIRPDIRHVDYSYFGGYEDTERQVLRFGSLETLGYEEDFPITALLIEPLINKFSDDLSHRDFLGALMNLGIKRSVLGDIILKDNKAYVFCLSEFSEYIKKELSRVKHTSVKITEIDDIDNNLKRKLEDFDILVSSNRFDAIVAAICKLSRGKAVELFREKKILLNNRICENTSHSLKEGSVFSIRGYGKYIYEGEGGKTRKDRVYLKMKRYV